MTEPQECPHCGQKPNFWDMVVRLRENNARLSESYRRQASAHAIKVANMEMLLMDAEARHQWYQKKTERQAKQLRVLQQKIEKMRGRVERQASHARSGDS
jgi:hypothetical protein